MGQNNQIIPNLGAEVWDVDAVSRDAGYNPALPLSGGNLAGLAATDWATFAGDVSQKLTAYNLKTFGFRYTGAPVVAKLARNLKVIKGPQALGDISAGAFAFDWVAWSNSGQTLFKRLTSAANFDPAITIPAFAAFFNQWRSRWSGYFDATGQPTVAVESSFTQITVFKSSLGTVVFNGYSPIMMSSTAVLFPALFEVGDNVIYYTKNINGSAVKKSDRFGDKIYCRVERDNYAVEYTICNTGFNLAFIEAFLFGSPYCYLVCRDTAGARYTFQTFPYTPILQDAVAGQSSLTAVSYVSIVLAVDVGPELIGGQSSLTNVSYVTVVFPVDVGTELVNGSSQLSNVTYTLTVFAVDAGTELVTGESALTTVSYVYVAPPTPPTVVYYDVLTPEAAVGAISIQGVTYV